jgi:spermidine/putrescine transport system substrate-binding protein
MAATDATPAAGVPPRKSLSRRRFLGTSALAAAGLGAAGVLSACGGSGNGSGGTEVVVLGWSSYVDPKIVKMMSDAGLSVKGVPAETDQEMFTKLKAGGGANYDIVFANCGWSPTFYKAGLIEAFDITEVPSYTSLYPIFREDTSLPYILEPNKVTLYPNLWDSLALMWNTEVAFQPPEPYSWNAMWDSRIPKGKVILKGAPEDFLAISGLSLGVPKQKIYAMTGDELANAAKHLAALKPFQIGPSDDIFANAIRSEKAWIGQVSNLAAAAALNKTAGSEISKTVIPKEGSLGWIDGMQLVKGAKNRGNALKFMDIWSSAPIQDFLYDTYGFSPCNRESTERQIAKGGDAAANIYNHGADKPENARQLVFQGPPENPAEWTRAYDEIVGG